MKVNLSNEFKKIFLYYFLYCFLFILIHIGLVSVFTFFHFLLDHEMGTVENWLNRNSWEIIVLSKICSFSLITKIFQLNSYQEIHPVRKILKTLTFPSKKIFGVCVFLLGMIYFYFSQVEGGHVQGNFREEIFYSSFIGAFFFYILDFLIIMILGEYYLLKQEDYIKTAYASALLFILTSKIVLPYMSKYYIFILIHFLTLFFIKKKGSLSDCLVYGSVVISILSSIYGLDLVWDNAYAVFHFTKEISIIALAGIWLLALGYYQFSRLK